MDKIKMRIVVEKVSSRVREHHIIMCGREEVTKIKGIVIMKSHDAIVDYTKWVSTIRMFAENAYGTHITYEIVETGNKLSQLQ